MIERRTTQLFSFVQLSYAFLDTMKSELAQFSHLIHPVGWSNLTLMVDASDFDVGAVLQQVVHGQMQLLLFLSYRLSH